MLFVQGGKTQFHYLFFDASENQIGSLDLPNFPAIARNSSLSKTVPKKIQGHVTFKWQEASFYLEQNLILTT